MIDRVRLAFPIFLFSAAAAAVAGAQFSQTLISGHAVVIDGDTILIGGAHIRLYGVDAPESSQHCNDDQGRPYGCGLLATSALEEEIGGDAVVCIPRDTDRYGRTVAVCAARGRDLGNALVRRGYAIAYRRYSTMYVDAEIEARETKRGLWSGTFQEPEAWRREHQR